MISNWIYFTELDFNFTRLRKTCKMKIIVGHHKAFTRDINFWVFFCILRWTCPNIKLFSFISFSTSPLQVCFVGPLLLFPVGIYLIGTLEMKVGCLLYTCICTTQMMQIKSSKDFASNMDKEHNTKGNWYCGTCHLFV